MSRTAKAPKSYASLSADERQTKALKSLTAAHAMLERAIQEIETDEPDYGRAAQLTRLVRADTLTADAIGRGNGATEEV